MKIILNLTLCIILAVTLQSCKKDNSDDTTTTTTTTPILQAYINGTVWTPDTLSATLTYTASTGVKELVCTGTQSQKRLVITARQTGAVNDSTFPLDTYTVDGTTKLTMAYYTQQLVLAGVYDFVLYGSTLQAGSGTLTVTAVDSVNKTITGTYSFTSSKLNYDAEGNYESITLASITSGVFNALPYTYKSN